MSELATLRKLRASNSKLMKGNLALLMSIREVDSEIQQEWLQLQQYCGVLERTGIAIPTSCLELMGNNDAETQASHDVPSANEHSSINMDCDEQFAHHEETKASIDMSCEEQLVQHPKPTSRLSVRSVLNDDSSEAEDNAVGDSASDQGSIEDS